MSDLLATWWVHEVVIDRYVGSSAFEGADEYDEATAGTAAFVDDGLKLIGNANGEQVMSTARVALPAGTPYVPINSRVTLPPKFGNRVCRVVSVSVADGGGLPTPDHVEIGLL